MIRLYFLTLYDHLLQAVLLNLIWAATVLPWVAFGATLGWASATAAAAVGQPFLAGLGAVAGGSLAGFSPPTLFLFVATRQWVRGGEGGVRGAWSLTRGLLWRAQGGGLLVTMAVTLLLGNALFYQSRLGWFGLALSGVMFWLLLGIALTAMLLFPVLVDNPDFSLRRCVRYAVLLVLDNLRRSALMAAATMACLLVGAVSGAGLALGAVPAAMLAIHLGFAGMLQRYGGTPVEADHRSLGDLLRPWQT